MVAAAEVAKATYESEESGSEESGDELESSIDMGKYFALYRSCACCSGKLKNRGIWVRGVDSLSREPAKLVVEPGHLTYEKKFIKYMY